MKGNGRPRTVVTPLIDVPESCLDQELEQVVGKALVSRRCYPTVEEAIDLAFEVPGHIVGVRSINLDQDWACIHRDLLALLGPVGSDHAHPVPELSSATSLVDASDRL